LKISKLIKPEHIQAKLLGVIINLAHDDRVEEFRIIAAKLLNVLSPVFGAKLCQEKVIAEVITLAEDFSFGVRKVVAQNVGILCKTVGPEITVESKLLPTFVTLCKDEIWGVRKSCAETLYTISSCLPSKVRGTTLVELFERFADDSSRWVKIEAFKQLGPFISTFDEEVPRTLISHFTGMALQGNQFDPDLLEYCAYNFPAVAHTLGPSRFPLLEKAYNTLVKDVQWKVRKTLAYSLTEIAKILGENALIEKYLCPAFELFLRDLDEVKQGVLSSLAGFLGFLSESTREKYFKILADLPDDLYFGYTISSSGCFDETLI
jgi:serine/threonine-protein phosphatase 4 regulatory subunit 1